VTQLFPTGDRQGKMLAEHQPVTLAAMEGLFQSEDGAPIALIGSAPRCGHVRSSVVRCRRRA